MAPFFDKNLWKLDFPGQIDGKLMETTPPPFTNGPSEGALCKLCKVNPSDRRSHVVPEFLLKWMYDDKGRFNYFEFKNGELIRIREVQNKSKPGIDFDPNLLCGECERKFSPWETYASKALYIWRKTQPRSVQFVDQETGLYENTLILKIDYKIFKLFQLSLLWRISASNIYFCRGISLGNYEEEIRQMLLNEDPGPADKFPCILINISFGNNPFLEISINYLAPKLLF